MARPMGPRFKQSRRFGVNIFGHPKELKRGPKTNQKLSEYGKQLLEKQKLKAYYGLSEKQMRKYMVQAIKESRKSDRITGDILVSLIERRLDNMVYRLGFAKSLRQARQMVVHGHIRVNGNKVDIPSYIVSVGDEISLRERSRSVDLFKDNIASTMITLPYLTRDDEKMSGRLAEMPERDRIPIEVVDSLIVEFYSKSL